MPFDPDQAEIRFGCGLAPGIDPPASIDAMMARLAGPDEVAHAFPIPDTAAYLERMVHVQAARKARRKVEGQEAKDEARKVYRRMIRATRAEAAGWTGQMLRRRALTGDGLRERLTAFWADHFTARGAGFVWPEAHLPYVETAIRPHVAKRFVDMLRAVSQEPLMLVYLDQSKSVGPNSARALKKGRGGLNENFARELLELHTLGAGGPYDQADVAALARLLTGLSYKLGRGYSYRAALAEPGPHVLLGQPLGGPDPEEAHVHAALDLLAHHPATAQHLARKMAVHFISDQPDPALVEAMRSAFLTTDGDLAAMTRAMLEHPAAWIPERGNVKPPVDFVGSALRALGLVAAHIPAENAKEMNQLFLAPLELMGQPQPRPPGPDGWPEADADWITPQRFAARLGWAMTVPFQLRRTLPDPGDFARHALGPALPEPVARAARRAETRAEGIGLVLASPAFQRV
ncbi:DUF1800 domain-containing protein [Roseovarius nanhaiticus]|uniref:DUF1800 domain-containing protein n=1 Tax=Roseovarius nanhaiticus TaxID=573024 RepID=UPI0024919C42|nr:DUF1800 domain-containing protein [Roseovarius nanhaiticus]